jgi:hypothetical protein
MDVATACVFRTLLRWACAQVPAGERASSVRIGPDDASALLRQLDQALGRVAGELPATTTLAAHLGQCALEHGVLPLLCEALLQAQTEDPAAWADAQRSACLDMLTGLCARDLSRSLAQVGLLRTSQQALQAQGIISLAAKGPLMGQLAYGGWSRRQSGQDIDLLVDASQVDRACSALSGLGFRLVRPLPVRARTAAMHHFGEIMLRQDQDPGAIIDLHWRLCMPYYRFCPETATLLTSARVLALDGLQDCRLSTLSAVETLLFAAVHGCKENWEQWRWLFDVALLVVRMPAQELAAALRLARSRGCLRMLLMTLELVRRCALVSVLPPPEISEREPVAAVQARACELRLLALSPARGNLLCRISDHWQDRVSAVTALARPWPVDWQDFDLPARLAWLYWLYRPCRLAWKYLWLALQALRAPRAPRTLDSASR